VFNTPKYQNSTGGILKAPILFCRPTCDALPLDGMHNNFIIHRVLERIKFRWIQAPGVGFLSGCEQAENKKIISTIIGYCVQ
jgi:hypothetical protein